MSDFQARAAAMGLIMDAVFGELVAIGKSHSCIFGSAILTKVLHQREFPKAKPLTVRVEISNPELASWIKANGAVSPELTPEDWESRGWLMVGLGDKRAEVEGEQWGGHLAVAVRDFFDDRHCLCDVTAVQANRAEAGIRLPPLLLRVGDEFLAGKKPFHIEACGCHLVYRAFPDDHDYNRYGHWTTIDGVDESVGRVLASLPA